MASAVLRPLPCAFVVACVLSAGLAAVPAEAAPESSEGPDLVVSVEVSPREVFVGEKVPYRVVITNRGPAAATGVEFRQTRSGATTHHWHQQAYNGTCESAAFNEGFACRWDSIAPLASVSVTTDLHPAAAGTAVVEDAVTLTEADATPAGNTSAGSLTIYEPRVGVWQTPQVAQPPARFGAVLVSDPVRKNLVLFGGHDGSAPLGDTWLWDGSAWTQAPTPVAPPARSHAVAAFDAASKTVMLFGGRGAAGALGDTWTWNGATWGRRSTGVAPSPRSEAGMAPAGGGVLLFGGLRGDGKLARDTWTWDGSTWTARAMANPPMPRRGMIVVTDEASGDVLMLGGCCNRDGRLFGEQWRWTGSVWTPAHLMGFRSGRIAAVAAFDRATATVVYTGGTDASGTVVDAAWSMTGTRWEQRAAANAARRDAAMAFYPTSAHPLGTLVLFGGKDRDGAVLGRTQTLLLTPAPRPHLDTGGVMFETMSDWPPPARAITLSNAGTRPFTVTSADWSEWTRDASDFGHTAGECRRRFEPGESCSFQVWYRPSGEPYDSASIVFDDGGRSLARVDLSGVGYQPSIGGTRYGSVAYGPNRPGGASFPVWWQIPLPGIVYDIQWAEQVRTAGGAWVIGPWRDWRIGTRTYQGWFGAEPRSVPGRTYFFRMRVRRGSQTTRWSSVAYPTVVPFDDRDARIVYAGPWTRNTVAAAFMGTTSVASSPSSRLTIRAETNHFAIIGSRYTTSGRFKIWVDGRYLGLVDTRTHLDAWFPGPRYVLKEIPFKGIGTHTLTIVPEGTRGRPAIHIDGIAVAR